MLISLSLLPFIAFHYCLSLLPFIAFHSRGLSLLPFIAWSVPPHQGTKAPRHQCKRTAERQSQSWGILARHRPGDSSKVLMAERCRLQILLRFQALQAAVSVQQ